MNTPQRVPLPVGPQLVVLPDCRLALGDRYGIAAAAGQDQTARLLRQRDDEQRIRREGPEGKGKQSQTVPSPQAADAALHQSTVGSHHIPGGRHAGRSSPQAHRKTAAFAGESTAQPDPPGDAADRQAEAIPGGKGPGGGHIAGRLVSGGGKAQAQSQNPRQTQQEAEQGQRQRQKKYVVENPAHIKHLTGKSGQQSA